MNQKEICHNFLTKYGWKLTDGEDPVYSKEDSIAISLDEDDSGGEIVFIAEQGDFLHVPLNIYALIGAMVTYRIIPVNFSI